MGRFLTRKSLGNPGKQENCPTPARIWEKMRVGERTQHGAAAIYFAHEKAPAAFDRTPFSWNKADLLSLGGQITVSVIWQCGAVRAISHRECVARPAEPPDCLLFERTRRPRLQRSSPLASRGQLLAQ